MQRKSTAPPQAYLLAPADNPVHVAEDAARALVDRIRVVSAPGIIPGDEEQVAGRLLGPSQFIHDNEMKDHDGGMRVEDSLPTFSPVLALKLCTVRPQRPRYLVLVSTTVCAHSWEE